MILSHPKLSGCWVQGHCQSQLVQCIFIPLEIELGSPKPDFWRGRGSRPSTSWGELRCSCFDPREVVHSRCVAFLLLLGFPGARLALGAGPTWPGTTVAFYLFSHSPRQVLSSAPRKSCHQASMASKYKTFTNFKPFFTSLLVP